VRTGVYQSGCSMFVSLDTGAEQDGIVKQIVVVGLYDIVSDEAVEPDLRRTFSHHQQTAPNRLQAGVQTLQATAEGRRS
jgi:hypothetical protein